MEDVAVELLGEEKIAWNDWLLFLSSNKTFVNETFDDNNEKYDRKFEIFYDNNESRRKVETDLRDCRWDQPQIGRSLSRNKQTGESTSFIRQQKSPKLLFLRTKLFEIFSSIKNEKKKFSSINQTSFNIVTCEPNLLQISRDPQTVSFPLLEKSTGEYFRENLDWISNDIKMNDGWKCLNCRLKI